MDFRRGEKYMVTGRAHPVLVGTFEATYTRDYELEGETVHNFLLIEHPFLIGISQSQIGSQELFDVNPV